MQALRNSPDLAVALIDALPDALLVVETSGRIAAINARGLALFGYQESQLVDQPVEVLVPERLRQKHQLLRNAYAERPELRPMAQGEELIALRSDGTEVSVQIALSPVQSSGRTFVLVALRETPDHVRALRLAEERYRSAIEQAPDAVFVANVDGHYTEVNTAACRMLGYTRAELLGKTIMDLLPEDELPRLARAKEQLLQPGAAQVAEWSLLRADGTRVPVEVSAMIHPDGRWQAFARDISERRRLEVALAGRDRLATVGTLAAGVGHEINNPLQHVTMNIELLRAELQGIAGGSPASRFSELIEMASDALRGAERIRKIVLGLHAFARGEREQLADLEPTMVLELSFNLAQNELRHRARLVTDFEPTPLVRADESRLAQVFINLLINAAQAMAARPADQNVIRVSTKTNAQGQAVVEIRDNGPGMSSAVRSHVFEPFFTTKPVGEGTGLGLAISYNIVTSLGGHLECESEPGAGALFRVTLPPAAASARAKSEVRELQRPTARGKILVVDDEPTVTRLLSRVLAPDHRLDLADDGITALAHLTEDADYDVILCDLMMPHMNGMELYQRVAQTRPDLARRFVFMTGGATRAPVQDFLSSVPNETLHKPFSVPAVRALISRMLESAA